MRANNFARTIDCLAACLHLGGIINNDVDVCVSCCSRGCRKRDRRRGLGQGGYEEQDETRQMTTGGTLGRQATRASGRWQLQRRALSVPEDSKGEGRASGGLAEG